MGQRWSEGKMWAGKERQYSAPHEHQQWAMLMSHPGTAPTTPPPVPVPCSDRKEFCVCPCSGTSEAMEGV
jgi:hypothetical protein